MRKNQSSPDLPAAVAKGQAKNRFPVRADRLKWRPEQRFNFSVAERPWGTQETQIEVHANEIFEAIKNHPENFQTYTLLSGTLKDRFNLPCEPERIYIPGNHDRLCNKYPSLRTKVADFLGIHHNPTQPLAHSYQNVNYGVLARYPERR